MPTTFEVGPFRPGCDREATLGYPLMSFAAWAVRHGCTIEHVDCYTVIHDPNIPAKQPVADIGEMQTRAIEALRHPTTPYAEAAAPFLQVA